MTTVPDKLTPAQAEAGANQSRHAKPLETAAPETPASEKSEAGQPRAGTTIFRDNRDNGENGSLRFEMPIYTKIGPATDMQWLFPGRIPRGQVTLIEGAHGAGKSFVALDLVARFTRGLAWPAPWKLGKDADPDFSNAFLGNVLLVTQQDDSATVDRRLAGLGADTDRICRIETVEVEEQAHEFSKPKTSQRPLEFPRDVALIREELAFTEGISLVVIDPLSDFCDGPARVAQTLRELNKLAREMDAAIVVTLPANCRFDSKGALRVASRYKTEAARCVWCVVADRDNPARRLFVARRPIRVSNHPAWRFASTKGTLSGTPRFRLIPSTRSVKNLGFAIT